MEHLVVIRGRRAHRWRCRVGRRLESADGFPADDDHADDRAVWMDGASVRLDDKIVVLLACTVEQRSDPVWSVFDYLEGTSHRSTLFVHLWFCTKDPGLITDVTMYKLHHT